MNPSNPSNPITQATLLSFALPPAFLASLSNSVPSVSLVSRPASIVSVPSVSVVNPHPSLTRHCNVVGLTPQALAYH